MPRFSLRCSHARQKKYYYLLLAFCLLPLVFQVIVSASSYAQRIKRTLPALATVIINGATRYQTIDGFGISEAFGPADQLHTLAAGSDRQRIVDFLFNRSTGAGFSIVRNLLPSDANHTIEPSNPGSPTATPHYTWDNSSWGQVWLAQQARSYGVQQFYLDAWSAPGFMKTNGDESNGGSLCGSPGASCNSGDWRQAYAHYLIQYMQDYQQSGIPITYLGFANEPNLKTSYSSMLMNPAQAADFANVLGPTVHASSLHPLIVCCEEEGWDLAQRYTNALARNNNINVISSHGYTEGPHFALTGTGQKHIWQTEWSTLFDTWNTAWDNGNNSGIAAAEPTTSATATTSTSNSSGFAWAQHLYTGLTVANLSAFFYWWGVGFTNNDNSTLLRYHHKAIEISKRLWAFANYSRFILPGAIRIGSISNSQDLEAVAFRNLSGIITIVVLNTSKSPLPITFLLQNTAIVQNSLVIPYMTNDANNTARQPTLAIRNNRFTTTVQARSLITYQIIATNHVFAPQVIAKPTHAIA